MMVMVSSSLPRRFRLGRRTLYGLIWIKELEHLSALEETQVALCECQGGRVDTQRCGAKSLKKKWCRLGDLNT